MNVKPALAVLVILYAAKEQGQRDRRRNDCLQPPSPFDHRL
ncbi:MAG: hypothetical protein AB1631_33940 [Acidobacteriota bacterium]